MQIPSDLLSFSHNQFLQFLITALYITSPETRNLLPSLAHHPVKIQNYTTIFIRFAATVNSSATTTTTTTIIIIIIIIITRVYV